MAVDEEGYFLLDGLRVSDVAIGRNWLSRLRMDDRGRATLAAGPLLPGEIPGRVLIEAFDQPLVALDVEVHSEIRARFPYGFETGLQADSFRSDEWDRFYARTTEGVPVVFSRAAQARLFQEASEYDDDSVTFGEGEMARTIAVRPLFDELVPASDAKWWNELYDKGEDRWDEGTHHPLLEAVIPPLKITRSRVLVLGCGAGHDAAWWEKRGHIVTGVDFSADALKRAKELYGESETLRWVQADIFKLPQSWTGSFDVVFESLVFCAIPPAHRDDLVRTWYRLLSHRGRLIALMLVMDKLSGPPFGASEWELRRRLLDTPTKKSSSRRAPFLPLLWSRQKNSSERRLGTELFLVVERADSLTD